MFHACSKCVPKTPPNLVPNFVDNWDKTNPPRTTLIRSKNNNITLAKTNTFCQSYTFSKTPRTPPKSRHLNHLPEHSNPPSSPNAGNLPHYLQTNPTTLPKPNNIKLAKNITFCRFYTFSKTHLTTHPHLKSRH